MRVGPVSAEFESQVVDLIVGIQRDEFEITITAEQQPDLRTIPSYYQTGSGNFWVALAENHVVGTVSLLDIGDQQAAHRFYEKHGFSRIPKSRLPPSFPVMEVDTRFYRLLVSDSGPARFMGVESRT